MLINLHVKNLALIKEVDVDFSNGLIVLTGETGAGKSLLLGSVNIALGNKVSKDIIRNGEDFALVELTFLTKKEQADFIRNMDIFVDDDNIITVSRKITESRSVSKINGETVNVKTLKTIMEMLIDIHGQHDHQSLLYPAKHLEILDKFAKDKIEDKLADLKELNNNYKKLKQKLDEYSMDEAQRAREIEFAKFEVDEIEQADLKENEEKRKKFEDTVANIFEKIENFSVRETKNSCGIQLPQKEYITEYVKFEHTQKVMYDSVLKDLEIELKQDENTVIDDDSLVLKRLLRLNQIASNPRMIDEDYKKISAKENILDDLLLQIINKNEKCIVWSNYIENIEYFGKKYSCYGARIIHGSLGIEERNNSVELFKTDDNCKVLFATPQAAKEGLTLTIANHVIFYDRGFNLDDYLQAQDRIHRISQKKKCYVYNLMIKNSVDEWIDKLLEAKQYAAFLAQGDINKSEYESNADYSYGNLIKDILGSENKGDEING